jgi:putative membrane protein
MKKPYPKKQEMMNDERKEYLSRSPDEALSKKLGIVAWILTAVVLILVGLMRRPDLRIPLPDGWSFAFLPPVHAVINTLVSIALVVAIVAVKQGKIVLHRNAIFAAMVLSVGFLLCYVAYHFTNAEVLYGDANRDGVLDAAERAAVGGARTAYLVLLISHIVLAGVSLPAILFTFIAGWTNRFAAHRRLAKWVFPMWLYVAVTGPICYLMLRPYYA